MKTVPSLLCLTLAVLLCALLAPSHQARAQPTDAELWSGVGLSLNLPKKMELGIGQQVRLKHHFTTFNNTHTNLTFSYEFSKRFSAEVEYRLRFATDVSGNGEAQLRQSSATHRFAVQAAYRTKKFGNDRLRFSGRLKSQHLFERNEEVENYLRGKGKLSLLFPRLDIKPYVAGEWFCRIARNGLFFDECRMETGMEYDFGKVHEIGLFYMLSLPLNQASSGRRHITGFEYSYELKWKSRKKRQAGKKAANK